MFIYKIIFPSLYLLAVCMYTYFNVQNDCEEAINRTS
jgi:hypothetical protein